MTMGSTMGAAEHYCHKLNIIMNIDGSSLRVIEQHPIDKSDNTKEKNLILYFISVNMKITLLISEIKTFYHLTSFMLNLMFYLSKYNHM